MNNKMKNRISCLNREPSEKKNGESFVEKVSSFSVDSITFATGYSSYAKRCVSLQKIGR